MTFLLGLEIRRPPWLKRGTFGALLKAANHAMGLWWCEKVLPKQAARNVLDADDAILAAVAKTTATMARAVKSAFAADGVTIQQFNEPAGGQVVFHLHVHVIPRFDGVRLKPHTGEMEDQAVLAANAEKIRQAF